MIAREDRWTGSPSSGNHIRGPRRALPALTVLLAIVAASCSSRSRPPATAERPPASAQSSAAERTDATDASSSRPAEESTRSGLTPDEIVALPPLEGFGVDRIDLNAVTLEELNALQPLNDVYFGYDSAELSDLARRTLETASNWLRDYPTVNILIEGHCDERGTVEYNLALGEERARAVRDYLSRLDVSGDRMGIVSYGKEFPFATGRNEEAWRQNRRAHLVITKK